MTVVSAQYATDILLGTCWLQLQAIEVTVLPAQSEYAKQSISTFAKVQKVQLEMQYKIH